MRGIMAELAAVSLGTSSSCSTPIAPPRRKRPTSNSQSIAGSQDTACGIRSVRPVPSTKPQRPSAPPRVSLSDHKPDPKSPSTVNSSGGHASPGYSQRSPSKEKRQTPTRAGVTNGSAKPSPLPRPRAGSNGAGLRQAAKSKQLQRENNKDCTSRSRDSMHSYQPRQPAPAQVSSKPAVSESSKYSPHKSVKQRDAAHKKSPISSPKRVPAARNQSPTKPKPPPRPSVTPVVKGTPSGNHPPSRPPNLPTTAASSQSWTSKTAPYSHLYGSSQSLPGPGVLAAKQNNKVDTRDNLDRDKRRSGSSSSLGHSDGLLAHKTHQMHGTMPRSTSHHDSLTLNSSTAAHYAVQGTRKSDTLKPRPRPAERKSNKVVSASMKSSGSVSPSKKNTSPIKKATPTSKIPPQRPARPPSMKKTKPAMLTFMKRVPDNYNTDGSTSQVQHTIAKRTYDEHIYMDPQIGYSSNARCHSGSEGSESGADYPYVVMTPVTSEHIYTALAMDTTDELEDYVIVDSGKDPDYSAHEYSAQDEGIHHYYNGTEQPLMKGEETGLDSNDRPSVTTIDQVSSQLQAAPSDDLYMNTGHLREEGNRIARSESSEDKKSVMELENDYDHLPQPFEDDGADDGTSAKKMYDSRTRNDQSDQPLEGEGAIEDDHLDRSLKDEVPKDDQSVQPLEGVSTEYDNSTLRLEGQDDQSDQPLEGKGAIKDVELDRPLGHESTEYYNSVQWLQGDGDGDGDDYSHLAPLEACDDTEGNLAASPDSETKRAGQNFEKEDDKEKENGDGQLTREQGGEDLDDQLARQLTEEPHANDQSDQLLLDGEEERSDRPLVDEIDRSKVDESLTMEGESVQSDEQMNDESVQSDELPYNEGGRTSVAWQVEDEDSKSIQQVKVEAAGVNKQPRENGLVLDMKNCQFESTKPETADCVDESRSGTAATDNEDGSRVADKGLGQQKNDCNCYNNITTNNDSGNISDHS